jgi:hypothetical protein
MWTNKMKFYINDVTLKPHLQNLAFLQSCHANLAMLNISTACDENLQNISTHSAFCMSQCQRLVPLLFAWFHRQTSAAYATIVGAAQ